MKNKIFVKGLVLAIVVLFIGTGVVSAFNANLTDDPNTTIITKKLATMDNHPPGLPSITGPTYMSPGVKEWKFEAIDPDGDNVSYQIDWGDGYYDSWFGWYASGEEITMSHDYQGYGRFRLMARAKDPHNATSEWAGISVVVSKSKQIINLPFIQFLELFQNAFPILRYVVRGR